MFKKSASVVFVCSFWLAACGGGSTTASPNASTSTTQPPTTVSSSLCQGTPVVPNVGNFKTYPGDCFVSYQLTPGDYKSLANAGTDFSSGVSINNKVIDEFKKNFSDKFDYIMVVWDVEKNAQAPYGFYSKSQNCSLASCPKYLGALTLTYFGGDSTSPIDSLRSGPSLHELLHQYANYAIPTADRDHWGFSSAKGQLGGFDGATLKQVSSGIYQATNGQVNAPYQTFGTFTNGGNGLPYSNIELYMMGLIPVTELQPLLVAQNPAWIDQKLGKFSADSIKTYTAADIVRLMGANAPDVSTSRKNYRAATIVLTDKDQISQQKYALLNEGLNQFSKQSAPDYAYNFWSATGGRATLTVNQLSTTKN